MCRNYANNMYLLRVDGRTDATLHTKKGAKVHVVLVALGSL